MSRFYTRRGRDFIRWTSVLSEYDPFIPPPWYDATNTTARDLGILLHAQIDARLKGMDVENPMRELNKFDAFLNARPTWKLIFNEKTVFSESTDIAGTFDALFEDEETDERILIDWKRILKLYPQSRERYSIQLNGYQKFIKEDLDIEIDQRMLVLIHPCKATCTTYEIDEMNIDHVLAMGKDVLKKYQEEEDACRREKDNESKTKHSQ